VFLLKQKKKSASRKHGGSRPGAPERKKVWRGLNDENSVAAQLVHDAEGGEYRRKEKKRYESGVRHIWTQRNLVLSRPTREGEGIVE